MSRTPRRLISAVAALLALGLAVTFATGRGGWPFAVFFGVLALLNGYQAWTAYPLWRRR